MLPVPVLLLPRRLRRRGSGVQRTTGLKRQLKSSPCPRARAARRAGPRPACPKQLERLKLRLHLPFTCSAAAGPARRGLWPPAAVSARPIEPTGRPGQMAARITARTAQARRLVAARVVPGPAAGESESASRPQLPVTVPGPDPARKGAWVARFEPRGRSASGPMDRGDSEAPYKEWIGSAGLTAVNALLPIFSVLPRPLPRHPDVLGLIVVRPRIHITTSQMH